MIRTLLLLLPFVSVSVAAPEALKFNQTTDTVRVSPGSKSANFLFRFVNESKTTVTITDLRASCGCTAPTVNQTVIAPAGEGFLRATLALGSEDGATVVKSISVTTDEPKPNTYHLTIRAEVSELVAVTPKQLFWSALDQPEPRTITIAYVPSAKVRLVSAADPKQLYTISGTDGVGQPVQLTVKPGGIGSRESSRAVLVFETVDKCTFEKVVFLHTLQSNPPTSTNDESPAQVSAQ